MASGIRIGTPAVTSRGMGPREMETIGDLIADGLAEPESAERLGTVKERVRELCRQFPLYDPLT